MDRWEDGAAGATTANQAGATISTGETATGATPGGAADISGTGTSAQGDGWTIEVEESTGLSPALRVGLIVGSASLAALALAGGVTWFIVQRRQRLSARKMAQAIAASRLLRMTPAIARPAMLEATEAGANATQYAQQTAAETARMARALGRAAGVSGSYARDYATERVATAQDALTNAYATARGGATGAWQSVAQASPFQPQWLIRAFNAGRYAGRIEQRMK